MATGGGGGSSGTLHCVCGEAVEVWLCSSENGQVEQLQVSYHPKEAAAVGQICDIR